MASKVKENRTKLFLIQDDGAKAVIKMKSSKIEPIVAKVGDFLFDEDDAKVVLLRCEETVFPTDKEGEKSDKYIVYVKNIDEVKRF